MSASARPELGEVTWGWWLLVLVGVLGVVAGVIILAKPGSSLQTLAVIAGIFLLVDGIFELAAAFMPATPPAHPRPSSTRSPTRCGSTTQSAPTCSTSPAPPAPSPHSAGAARLSGVSARPSSASSTASARPRL
jgi:hypothetical protein